MKLGYWSQQVEIAFLNLAIRAGETAFEESDASCVRSQLGQRNHGCAYKVPFAARILEGSLECPEQALLDRLPNG